MSRYRNSCHLGVCVYVSAVSSRLGRGHWTWCRPRGADHSGHPATPRAFTWAREGQGGSCSCLVKNDVIKAVIGTEPLDLLLVPVLWRGCLRVCHRDCFCLSYLVQSKQATLTARAATKPLRSCLRALLSIALHTPAASEPPPAPPHRSPAEGRHRPTLCSTTGRAAPGLPVLTAPSLCHPPGGKRCTPHPRGAPRPRHPAARGPAAAAAAEGPGRSSGSWKPREGLKKQSKNASITKNPIKTKNQTHIPPKNNPKDLLTGLFQDCAEAQHKKYLSPPLWHKVSANE